MFQPGTELRDSLAWGHTHNPGTWEADKMVTGILLPAQLHSEAHKNQTKAFIFISQSHFGAHLKAECVKGLAAKPDDPSSISRHHS